ncbi:PstS family phosphate ABC transporter substrate-binding protein [Pseudodesulfovibrio piezophilus]|uniref:Periplasmic phosphate binding protein n=1 Tax=Pseudodesulfovibrio piezophilus (strain DSM 21447 / JCM 15486 / C1TLV30) TaxID=1322246 RepID=M1WSM1_PSEP2|nr:PstS family phosphate ABC transporter substrate-binding protein [Pseudodesulfovibrio piezophilus]CCH50274.1 Periplasmic phosphate binding protein [Pseudodesulfovibrio piezophilus C1TLV30]
MPKFMKMLVVAAAIVAFGAGMAQARDQIKIVGSSTVYPFSSYVAEELGATTKFKSPVVESTGSGGGHKLFGAGIGLDTPDITNSSRRMKASEFEKDQKVGITEITEALIGYDGIAVAQNGANPEFSLTKDELAMAVAEMVPMDGKLVKNPYKTWNQINAKFPNRKILFYGPPTSSGTRDAFGEMVLGKFAKKHKDLYAAVSPKGKADKYESVRQDGVYVPAGENDNLIVQKLTKDKNAFGIFGYSFLEENSDRISGAKINGVSPEPTTIANGEYPISRSLYFYIKKAHMDKVPGMKEYIELFMSDKMIGPKGLLKRIGLVPLGDDLRKQVQKDVLSYKNLTLEDLKH